MNFLLQHESTSRHPLATTHHLTQSTPRAACLCLTQLTKHRTHPPPWLQSRILTSVDTGKKATAATDHCDGKACVAWRFVWYPPFCTNLHATQALQLRGLRACLRRPLRRQARRQHLHRRCWRGGTCQGRVCRSECLFTSGKRLRTHSPRPRHRLLNTAPSGVLAAQQGRPV